MKLINEIENYLIKIKESEFKEYYIDRFNTKIKYYIKKVKKQQLQAFHDEIKDYGKMFSQINYLQYSKMLFEGIKDVDIRNMLCFVFDLPLLEI
jgi:Na+/phosphate symporter